MTICFVLSILFIHGAIKKVILKYSADVFNPFDHCWAQIFIAVSYDKVRSIFDGVKGMGLVAKEVVANALLFLKNTIDFFCKNLKPVDNQIRYQKIWGFPTFI